MAGYSRDDEREADQLGFVHSFKAGYNPYGMGHGPAQIGEYESKLSPGSIFQSSRGEFAGGKSYYAREAGVRPLWTKAPSR